MIGKVPRSGTGFRGIVAYLMKGKKSQPDPNRVAWSAMRNIPVDDIDLAPRLMRAVAEQSLRCQKPVYHLVVSWSKGENPTDELMRTVGATTLSDLDLHEHQAILIAHTDTAHKHLHMVVNRVHPETGKAWHASQDYKRIEISLRRQAEAMGMAYVPGRFNDPEAFGGKPKRVRDGEYQAAVRHGAHVPLPKWSLEEIKSRRSQILPMLEDSRSWSQLAYRFDAAGLTLKKKGQGLVVSDGLGFVKLSDLGKQVRLAGLEQRFGQSFDDFALLPRVPAPPDVVRPLVMRPVAPAAVEEFATEVVHEAEIPPADAAEDEDDPHGLSEEEKERLRDEERLRRQLEREETLASRQGNPASDDTDAPERRHVPQRRPVPTEQQDTSAMSSDARRAATAKLDQAHQEHDLLRAMGTAFGLDVKDALEKTSRALGAAQEEADRHKTGVELLHDQLGDLFADEPPPPQDAPEDAFEMDEDEMMLEQKRKREKQRTRDR